MIGSCMQKFQGFMGTHQAHLFLFTFLSLILSLRKSTKQMRASARGHQLGHVIGRERERDLHKLVALAARQSEANFLALSVPALFRLLLVCAHGDEDTRVRGMRVSAVSADRKRESARVPCVAGGREEALTVVLRFGRALCALAVDRAAGRKDGGGAGEEGRGQLKAWPCGFSRGTIRGTYSASVPSLSDEDEDWEVDCPLEA